MLVVQAWFYSRPDPAVPLQPSQTPPLTSQNTPGARAAGPDQIVYIFDQDLIRFVKVASAILAIFVTVGLTLWGFDVKQAAKEAHDAADRANEFKNQAGEKNDAINKAKAEIDGMYKNMANQQAKAKTYLTEIQDYAQLSNDVFNRVTLTYYSTAMTGINRIPWPEGMAPSPMLLDPTPVPDAPLPQCDILVITWTVAEAKALSGVLTPGFTAVPRSDTKEKSWYRYAHLFDAQYRDRLGPQAPAILSRVLGSYGVTTIGAKKVLCFKSDLHFTTDGPEFPLLTLLRQIIKETNARLVITTGTACAIGPNLGMGDVVVAASARFYCARTFKDAPFSEKTVISGTRIPASKLKWASENLLQANADKLDGNGGHAARTYWDKIELGEPDVIVTTDFFAFDTVTDRYGLRGLGAAVESDDAAIGLACEQLGREAPKWLAIRGISTPQVKGDGATPEISNALVQAYKKYGFWVAVSSSIATWAAIAGYEEK
jgi:nucleoside phosphorylase